MFSHQAGPAVDSRELLEHPQRLPNLLRACTNSAVGLPKFERGGGDFAEGYNEEEEDSGWKDGR